jgi:rhomboid family GlyGly-CTERM serine protease
LDISSARCAGNNAENEIRPERTVEMVMSQGVGQTSVVLSGRVFIERAHQTLPCLANFQRRFATMMPRTTNFIGGTYQMHSGVGLRLPGITLWVVAVAILIAQFPGWSSWLVYDRAAILSGEIWRMFTGHWVHFSRSHLVYDALAFGLAGWMIETRRLPNFVWLCLVTPWLVSGVMLVMEPQMRFFGGLSALGTAAVVYLALCGLHEKGLWSWACLVTLAGVVGKIEFEVVTGRMVFVRAGDGMMVVCTASHVVGVVVAMGFYGWAVLGKRK